MVLLPAPVAKVLAPFACFFSRRVWHHAQILLVGALLCPAARTVTQVLRVLGLAQEKQFQNYHRVLNRAVWPARLLSRVLLGLLVRAFVPEDATICIGLDETLERRRGEKIQAKGIYRDAVRSSKNIHVKTPGLRWMSAMLLAEVPWAKRVWALPFLTLLMPSQKGCTEQGRPYKTVAQWARLVLVQLRRWLPGRKILVVADNNYSALEVLGQAVKSKITFITRLRLDAALYDPPPTKEEWRKEHPRGRIPTHHGKRQAKLEARLADPEQKWTRLAVAWYGGQTRELEILTGTSIWYRRGLPAVRLRWVLIRDPKRKFDPLALLSTDPAMTAQEIIEHFVLRWPVEVTFHEVRAHLGVETQRQWSPKAIARTTPVLLGLFSLSALMAKEILAGSDLPARRAAWYHKEQPTFSDTIALVRRHLWPVAIPARSQAEDDRVLISRSLLERFTDTLAWAS